MTGQTDGAPQFRDGVMPDENGPGNRRRLYVRHAPLLTLMRLRSMPTEGQLAARSGADQGTVPGYLMLCRPALSSILPTAGSISGQLKKLNSGDRKRFLPGRNGGSITIDGTRIPCKRSGSPEGRRGTYSGRIRRRPVNTPFGISGDDVVVWISRTHSGGVHDASMAG